METNTAFVRANGIVELHTIAEVGLNITFVVHPSNTERKDTVGFNQAFYDFSFLELWMLVIDIFDGKKSAAFLAGIYGGGGIDAIGEYVVRPGDLYAEHG